MNKDDLEKDEQRIIGEDKNAIAFLVSVKGEIEYSIIESKLKQLEIPILKKYKESGAYLAIYTGNTPFGIDIYVPQRSLEFAKNAIELCSGFSKTDPETINGTIDETGIDDVNIKDKSFDRDSKGYIKKRKFIAWILISFSILAIVIIIINVISSLAD